MIGFVVTILLIVALAAASLVIRRRRRRAAQRVVPASRQVPPRTSSASAASLDTRQRVILERGYVLHRADGQRELRLMGTNRRQRRAAARRAS